MLEWIGNHKDAWLKKRLRYFSSFLASKRNGSSCDAKEKSVPDMPPRLSQLGHELQTISEGVEPVFLKLGGELQEIYSGASELTDQTLEAVEFISGKTDRAILSRVGKLAHGALEKLRSCQEQVISKLRFIDEVAQELDGLNDMCDVIEKIAKYLRVVGLNIGIESSRSPETLDMFGVAVDEIKNFVEKVVGVAEEIRMDSKAAQVMQISSHNQISEGLNHLSDLAHDAEAFVNEALEKIEELVERSTIALEEATLHSREISRQVGEVVVGIQFQDNMKQRIEHIVDGLYDAAGLCNEEKKEGASKENQKETLGFAHSIILLQTAQLEQVIAGVDQVHLNAVEAFTNISDEVGKLGHGLALFGIELEESPREYEGKKNDPFGSLIQGLDQLYRLVDQGQDLMQRIKMAITSATQTAAKLTERTKYVRRISLETQLMAINAVIKAAHLGDRGRTLDVLAQEVSALSDRTNEFVDGVEKIIKSLTSLARELTASADENGMVAFAEKKDATSENDGSHEISIAFGDFQKDSSETLKRAAALEDMISQTSSGLDFLRNLGHEFDAKLKQLNAIGDLLAPWAGMVVSDSVVGTERLGQRYTMQHERDIHERITEGKGQASAVVFAPLVMVAEDGRGEEKEDQESNVELFSDETDDAEGNPGDNVELFGIEDTDGVGDMGDNVELF